MTHSLGAGEISSFPKAKAATEPLGSTHIGLYIQRSPYVRTGLSPHGLLAITGHTINLPSGITEWMRSPPLRVKPSMSSRASLILVVEDDPNQQELLQMVLKHIGVTEPIHCVGDAMAAIAYLQGEGPYPTLIITDLQMSPGDGYALLLYLRNHPSIIGLTM